MDKIGLIPLDSRPCNFSWPKELGEIANLDVLSTPLHHCGTLLKPADFDNLENWIYSNVSSLDYIIIAADAIFSGGLVQSRNGKLNLNEAYERLSLFNKIKHINPNIKIYVYDTLMRTSISTVDKQSATYWSLMNKYSYYFGQYHLFNKNEDKNRIDELLNVIPKEIIDSYHLAREKKHIINKELIKLTCLSIIDYLLILQEDSMPDGIQIIEQRILDQLIEDSKVENNVKIYNGTDEAACVLVSKIALEINKTNPKLYLLVPNENILNKVMPFEDRKFSSNLEKLMEVINMSLVQNPIDANFIFSIYSENNQSLMEIENHVISKLPNISSEYYNFINKINNFINNGYKVGFLDLLFPNGGSYEILKDIKYQSLVSYSAWNTASNAMGTLLAQFACYDVNNKLKYNNDKLNKLFTYERIIDDCFYQGVIRNELHHIGKDKDWNIFNLGECGDEAIDLISEKLIEFTKNKSNVNFTVSLPFNRLFEINLKINKID